MRRVLNLCAIALLVLCASRLRAVQVCEADGRALTAFGARFTENHAQVNGQHRQAILSHNEQLNPSRYLRLRIVLVQPAGDAWQLVLRDNDYRPLQVISTADFAGEGSSQWSKRLETRTVKLDLSSPAALPELAVREYIAMPERAEHPFYSVQGSEPLWRDLFATPGSDAWKRAGDAVGMLVGGRQSSTWCCSGVVVQRKPRLLFLTNFHCGAPDPSLADSAFWSSDVCASTVVDFSWDGDSTSREFACSRVASVDPERDLALLELKPLGADPGPPPPELYLGPTDGVEDLVILHHPECRSKQMSRGCAVEDRSVAGWRDGSGESDFTHRCDTESGSSGAPVFDHDGRLVGIHHLGFEARNGTCDRLNKGVWLDAARAAMVSAGVEGLPPVENHDP